MRRDEIFPELEHAAFDFFFSFSRFEFALKEGGYLQDIKPGAVAQPGWAQFVASFCATYASSAAGTQLIALSPMRQRVSADGTLCFEEENFDGNASDLEKVTRLLKNVRNNLFHGGKHGPRGWTDPARTIELLHCAAQLIQELAEFGDIQNDFSAHY